MAIRLVLADDHAVVREGVIALLASDPDFEVVGQAGDGAEVLDLVERLQPDVVVLDLMMPGPGGLEVTGQLARRPNPPAVLILTMHESEAYVVEAMRRGAAGYALKQAPSGELARGIRTVATGARYLSPPLSDRAVDAYLRGPDQQQEPEDMLTVRERDVLRLAAAGRSNAEVAALLFISRRTVETHRARAMKSSDSATTWSWRATPSSGGSSRRAPGRPRRRTGAPGHRCARHTCRYGCRIE